VLANEFSIKACFYISKCIADWESAVPFYAIITVREYKCGFVLLTKCENLIVIYKLKF